ncbi:MAG: hypothetical protein U0V02_20705 [Anaerolineales bacterium]
MKKLFFAFIIVFLISACGPRATETPPSIATVPPAALATPACISSEPTDKDIDRALTYTEGLFSAPKWERTYTVGGGRVSVTWSDSADTAVAYLEALIFPCSYEEPDLNNFFNLDNWQIIFANYESYQAVAECRTDNGLRLYQFSAVDSGFTYNINYWAKNDTDTRVIGMMIVFPAESSALMDEYSNSLFPELTSCN